MFLQEVMNSGAMPALEATVRFSAQRQRLLVHNIANMSTPNFRPLDVAPGRFQQLLGKAVESRRARNGGAFGALEMANDREIRTDADGDLTIVPGQPSNNLLFHDRNNRDLERHMQDLSENVGVFRVSSELLRTRYELLRATIAERA